MQQWPRRSCQFYVGFVSAYMRFSRGEKRAYPPAWYVPQWAMLLCSLNTRGVHRLAGISSFIVVLDPNASDSVHSTGCSFGIFSQGLLMIFNRTIAVTQSYERFQAGFVEQQVVQLRGSPSMPKRIYAHDVANAFATVYIRWKRNGQSCGSDLRETLLLF